MTTRGDIARALLAFALACATWLTSGCLDSIVGAECAGGASVDGRCVADGEGQPDGGERGDPGDFTTGRHEGGGGGGPGGSDAGATGGGEADAGSGDQADAAPDEPLCEDGLEWCAGECVDLSSDPMNCGECGNECDSGICEDGTCRDGVSGHVILIGHDFTSKNAAIGRLLGNSVFLALGNTVDVVTYRGNGDPDAITSANQSVSAHGASIGRSWNRIAAANAAEVPGLLATADVFLIYDQNEVEGGDLTELGAGWADALAHFTARDGIVIVLDDGDTWPILTGAGLMDLSGATPVAEQVLAVTDPSDAVGSNVPLLYWAAADSVAFTGTSAPVVVETADHQPVVLHRPVF